MADLNRTITCVWKQNFITRFETRKKFIHWMILFHVIINNLWILCFISLTLLKTLFFSFFLFNEWKSVPVRGNLFPWTAITEFWVSGNLKLFLLDFSWITSSDFIFKSKEFILWQGKVLKIKYSHAVWILWFLRVAIFLFLLYFSNR